MDVSLGGMARRLADAEDEIIRLRAALAQGVDSRLTSPVAFALHAAANMVDDQAEIARSNGENSARTALKQAADDIRALIVNE